MRDIGPDALVNRAGELRRRVLQGGRTNSPKSLLAESFALVNESLRRVHGMEYYDVQLLAGATLVAGRIAEMATGEGKTLVQGLAAFNLALPGCGVHVMTSNAYLAERDCNLLSPVLSQLGLRVAALKRGAGIEEKKRAYQADITFGAGFEFGFDFLRDQTAKQLHNRPQLGQSYRRLLRGERPVEVPQMQRGHAVAIVDEADSVMIDEATTPLILSSGPGSEPVGSEAYEAADRAAVQLEEDRHFLIDRTDRRIQLTVEGSQVVSRKFPPPVQARLERPWLNYIEQALFAKHLLRRDVDYVVRDGKVLLVDQSTGRVFSDRTLRNGLHQAVEVREKLAPSASTATMGRISRQKYLGLYGSLCGMTGTARGAEREFWSNYRLRASVIPTRKPGRRIIEPTRYFINRELKHRAIVEDVARRQERGQPVLVGTRTIDESVALDRLFTGRGIDHQVLNGVQDADEASVVAQAGQPSCVTIATNIAGRGTDIRLAPGVVECGGLHVIACEPHDTARVDRQLFGRCARQGDPGSCRLFVSADDHLLRNFGQRFARKIRRLADTSGEAVHDWTASVRRLQRRAEQQQYIHRRSMLDHDRWIDDVMRKLA